MTTRDVYKGIGDYDRMCACIAKEESIRKFLRMFLNDENFEILKSALAANDVHRAFLGAHTLKGVCQNLCLTSLYEIDYIVTEALRAGNIDEAKLRMPELTARYNLAIEQISKMDEE